MAAEHVPEIRGFMKDDDVVDTILNPLLNREYDPFLGCSVEADSNSSEEPRMKIRKEKPLEVL